MLELRNVHKRYASIPAVDGVSFIGSCGRDYRLSGCKRVGKVDHDEDDHGVDRAKRRRDSV